MIKSYIKVFIKLKILINYTFKNCFVYYSFNNFLYVSDILIYLSCSFLYIMTLLKYIAKIVFLSFLVIQFSDAQLPTKPPEQKPVLSRILFIFDASQSMNGNWEKNIKINIARNVLIG